MQSIRTFVIIAFSFAAASDETLRTVLSGAVIADEASAAYLAERGLVSKAAVKLDVEMRTDSHNLRPRIADTPFGGKLAVIGNWWPYGKRAAELLEYLRMADDVCGGRLPLLPEEPAMAAIMPRVREDGSFAAAAIVNTRIDEQPSFKVRLRNFKGNKIAWHALDTPFAVALDIVRDNPDGDATVAIPAVGEDDVSALRRQIGNKAEAVGICTRSTMGGRQQIGRIVCLAGPEDLHLEKTEPADLFAAPELDRLEALSPAEIATCDRHRCRGQVLALWDNTEKALLRNPLGHVVRVEFATQPSPAVGACVEAVGFAESDMFSLGTVGWEMLTGLRLFKAGKEIDLEEYR